MIPKKPQSDRSGDKNDERASGHQQRLPECGFSDGAQYKSDQKGSRGKPEFDHEKTDDAEKNHNTDIKHGMLNRIGANDTEYKHNRKQNPPRHFA